MAWMTIEAAVAIVSGILASSIALIGFGLDSVSRSAAGSILLFAPVSASGHRWQWRGISILESCQLASQRRMSRATAPHG
jgi:hypothetical protein